MKKNILFILGIFILSLEGVFAVECPQFPESKISGDEIIAKIDECQKARSDNTTATIEDFHCPNGDFAVEDNLPLSDERIAYHIATNLLINEADQEIKKYMQQLQKHRSKDAVAWTENIRTCVHGSGESKNKSIAEVYRNICAFGNIANLLNNNSSQRVIIATTQSQPQIACDTIIQKKIRGWEILANNLMTAGIHKSFENDRNRFLDGVQGAYRAIIEKFHTYQKIIFRTSSKVGPYIQNPVK